MYSTIRTIYTHNLTKVSSWLCTVYQLPCKHFGKTFRRCRDITAWLYHRTKYLTKLKESTTTPSIEQGSKRYIHMEKRRWIFNLKIRLSKCQHKKDCDARMGIVVGCSDDTDAHKTGKKFVRCWFYDNFGHKCTTQQWFYCVFSRVNKYKIQIKANLCKNCPIKWFSYEI